MLPNIRVATTKEILNAVGALDPENRQKVLDFARALAAQAVRAFASFEPEPGLKFDKIYEVYSQRFQREDFDEDDKFDPKVLPSSYLLEPKQGDAFVYVCKAPGLLNVMGSVLQSGLKGMYVPDP